MKKNDKEIVRGDKGEVLIDYNDVLKHAVKQLAYYSREKIHMVETSNLRN